MSFGFHDGGDFGAYDDGFDEDVVGCEMSESDEDSYDAPIARQPLTVSECLIQEHQLAPQFAKALVKAHQMHMFGREGACDACIGDGKEAETCEDKAALVIK
ncbi:hypothetical protein KIPB_013625, partial [Kipferlia bialata]|eukprot:g13625.t1